MWLQYGGNWAAAGAHGACPEAYKGKAYVNEQVGPPLARPARAAHTNA